MDNTSTFFFFTVIVVWVPVSLVLWWRNMAEYSSPYKVGLIDVGTKFASQKLTCLAWSSVWKKLNFWGHFFFLQKTSYFSHTLYLINLPRFKYFSVGKVCGFLCFLRFGFSIGSVHSAFSGFRFDFQPNCGFGFKKREGLVSIMSR